MLIRFLLVAGLASAVTSARAQTAPEPPTAPPTETKYYDANRHVLPTEVGAVEKRVTTYRDTLSATVRTYYLPSGKAKLFAPYADMRHALRHGTVSEFYESGQLRFQATYVAGKLVGDLLTYYPDGILKRRQHHQPNEADPTVTGECFGPDGKPVPFFPYEQMPVYPEGAGDKAAVARAVQMNTKYPSLALRYQVSGVVKVKFVVDRTGQVTSVEPVPPAENAVPAKLARAYQALQDAASDAVRQLKPFVPGKQDGEPVAVSFTVPVTFRMQ
ncbi:TonB family protein [Hymenobacter sp. 5317J-9]|uniref:energy transducer TonB n=1 Tax=Hymenobacter sp. 5317J-9 TaxID=2932250 RepID=UPI001FD6B571|nr:energy transducer TonB [Hymenobacter sp. 5317J-9]UOQ95974.1 TonB family protein [Hymenobacter sp. 5317J-9]